MKDEDIKNQEIADSIINSCDNCNYQDYWMIDEPCCDCENYNQWTWKRIEKWGE